jgi:rSAM/selenodomain-associated transferase 2
MMRLSIIIPVLNEAATIEGALRALHAVRNLGREGDHDCELIVVDGGSEDDTVARSTPLADAVLQAPRGRATQMNAGATVARGDVLLFLHADTQLPDNAAALICEGLDQTLRVWGRFDVAIDGRPAMLKLVAMLMNLRSRMSGIATGDQAIFVRRSVFHALDGYPNQPLMEDIEISRRLKTLSRPLCLREKVRTSGRRWEQYGVWRTIFLMWRLRFQYWLGKRPEELARAYR